MRRCGKVVLGLGLLTAAAAAGLAMSPGEEERADDLVVHEWGTFLSVGGSDGVALEGMYHEEHALPAFVHARGRDQLRLPSVILKGETPVIYFYTGRARPVRVEVKFPRGLWTQWYPQAQVVSPSFSQAVTPYDLRDGRIRWCAQIVPPGKDGSGPSLPATSSDALWNHAREVDAAYVLADDRTVDPAKTEAERFLFYRGLGEVPLPLRFSADHGGTLAAEPGDWGGARHVFAIRIEGGRAAYAYRPALPAGERASDVIPSMDGAIPVAQFADRIAADLEARLVESGLYPKEARAMVNTWRTSYFQTEGIRALVVMPQAWTDRFIPLDIKPTPRQVVRVMVGRLELMTADRERRAEEAVKSLAASDSAERERAFGYLRDQGRYVEPILRRVVRTSQDEGVRRLCHRLLKTDFVTELRAAIHDASDGRRVMDDPVHVRAQLACLLREVGLDDEAKAEGSRVVEALKSRGAPPTDRPEAREYFRAYARAMEGLGDSKGAAEWYGRFIDYGVQVARKEDCRFCHRDAGPKDLAWFRDWWAGDRYALHTSRTVGAEPAIAEQRAILEDAPKDLPARMKLAYLLKAAGRDKESLALWSGLASETPPDAQARREPGR
jgi:hypothetical protein